jgi:hypothetical protein
MREWLIPQPAEGIPLGEWFKPKDAHDKIVGSSPFPVARTAFPPGNVPFLVFPSCETRGMGSTVTIAPHSP